MSTVRGISRRMKAWRAWFGLTQADAALQLHVSLSTWNRWERVGPIPYREYQRIHAHIDEWMRDGDVEGAPWWLKHRDPLAGFHDASERGGSRSG